MSAPISFGAVPYRAGETVYLPLGLFQALLGNEGTVEMTADGISITTEAAGAVSLPNPFVGCENLREAEKLAGFSLSMPDRIPNWMEEMKFQAVEDEMLEVIFAGSGREIRLRKARGSEDISGDYRSWSQTDTMSRYGRPVTLKGENDLVFVAT